MSIHALLKQCIERGASDLHIGEGRVPALRIDGDIRPLDCAPLSAAEMEAVLRETMNETRFAEFQQTWESDYAFALPEARFRVNAFYRSGGAAAVFRQIPNRIPEWQEIAAPPVLQQIAAAPRGLVLLTGPTGSGKSTTLAAMVKYINETRACHILTIEDPIEFVYTGQRAIVSQRELNRHTKSFAAALRAALREDPDVILVGEMRDAET
ncbi:MAG: ATPase, T2SS/T4P/T4SS family, partial [Neisseria sp.]|nr:ATPase, T2SS/T4P/T4SS family [Neisseria sp.]